MKIIIPAPSKDFRKSRCLMQQQPELMSTSFRQASLRWCRFGPTLATLWQHAWPWALLRRALRQRLSPPRLWARRTAPLARIGGYSGRGASRVLARAHRPPRGSVSVFLTTTPARDGHGPCATQVRSLVLTTLTLSLGTATRRRCGRRLATTVDDRRPPTIDDER